MFMTKEELFRRQALPLEEKINMTCHAIEEFYLHYNGQVYLSFSGGKDSSVLLDIIKKNDYQYLFNADFIPTVFCDTGLEYPEVREHALNITDVVLQPEKNFRRIIQENGYPLISKEQSRYIRQAKHTNSEYLWNIRMGNIEGRTSGRISKKWQFLVEAPFEISEQCCDYIKKKPFHKYEKETKRKPILGTMAEESTLRMQWYLKNGCNSFEGGKEKSTPLGFWTEQDILKYIKENDVEIPSVYGQILQDEEGKFYTSGCERTGCMFCMFGVQYDESPNRFQKMKETHPKQWDYCINKLNLKEPLEYIGVDYE